MWKRKLVNNWLNSGKDFFVGFSFDITLLWHLLLHFGLTIAGVFPIIGHVLGWKFSLAWNLAYEFSQGENYSGFPRDGITVNDNLRFHFHDFFGIGDFIAGIVGMYCAEWVVKPWILKLIASLWTN